MIVQSSTPVAVTPRLRADSACNGPLPSREQPKRRLPKQTSPDRIYKLGKHQSGRIAVFARRDIRAGTRIISEVPFTSQGRTELVAPATVAIDMDALTSADARRLSELGEERSVRARWNKAWHSVYSNDPHPEKEAIENFLLMTATIQTLVYDTVLFPNQSAVRKNLQSFKMAELLTWLAVYDSNRLAFDQRNMYGAILVHHISFVRHSALPNAIACFSEANRCVTLHAMCNVKRGQEIFIDLVPAIAPVSRGHQTKISC